MIGYNQKPLRMGNSKVNNGNVQLYCEIAREENSILELPFLHFLFDTDVIFRSPFYQELKLL